jgi:Zn-dependent protease
MHPESGNATAAPRPRLGRLAGLGALGLVLWKFKGLAIFLLTKGKVLLLGLTKAKTLFSMLLSMGAYASAWGWQFAVGFVLSIYVHEMGHVMALRRLGIGATAPMFIPFVGAFIRAKEYPASPREDAEVGLAGPLWGLGASIACLAVAIATGSPFWAALARTGAWLNLFNLLPVWQLDGGRGFNALTRKQRWWAAGALGAAWALSEESLLALLLLAALFRAAVGQPAERPDRSAFVKYVGLVAVLAWLASLSIQVPS